MLDKLDYLEHKLTLVTAFAKFNSVNIDITRDLYKRILNDGNRSQLNALSGPNVAKHFTLDFSDSGNIILKFYGNGTLELENNSDNRAKIFEVWDKITDSIVEGNVTGLNDVFNKINTDTNKGLTLISSGNGMVVAYQNTDVENNNEPPPPPHFPNPLTPKEANEVWELLNNTK
jgi:hypothetical protein